MGQVVIIGAEIKKRRIKALQAHLALALVFDNDPLSHHILLLIGFDMQLYAQGTDPVEKRKNTMHDTLRKVLLIVFEGELGYQAAVGIDDTERRFVYITQPKRRIGLVVGLPVTIGTVVTPPTG